MEDYLQTHHYQFTTVNDPQGKIADQWQVNVTPAIIILNKGKIVAIDTPENLEKKVNNNNTVYVTVEDLEQKMDSIKDKIEEIKDVKLVKENEDGTKQYVIEANGDTDLRKVIFSGFAKENITIFEMKKADITLEDAFMQLIEGGEK